MGLLSWFKPPPKTSVALPPQDPAPVPDMNGAVEVPRPPQIKVTVFEFGSVAASADKVTIAGYCPVSDELEPCRWAILPAAEDDAPQFRVVF